MRPSMRSLCCLVLLLLSTPAFAQVQSRPTDPPLVTAANESWFVQREPIAIAGDLYYPAGAAVFFSGYTMVRSGHYNGVPVYTDATLEPYSVIFVPISRGMLQPYERRRAGALAGTTGSRLPSFPVRVLPDAGDALYGMGIGMAAAAPTALPQPPGAISVYTPPPMTLPASLPAVTTTAAAPPRATAPAFTRGFTTLTPPESNDGVWLQFRGERWIHEGRSVPYAPASFVQVGDYAGFPVYARQGLQEDAIYLPTREGQIARYRLK